MQYKTNLFGLPTNTGTKIAYVTSSLPDGAARDARCLTLWHREAEKSGYFDAALANICFKKQALMV